MWGGRHPAPQIAYKYLNYATATVLRSTKLVFVMAVSAAWLGRRFSRWDCAVGAEGREGGRSKGLGYDG